MKCDKLLVMAAATLIAVVGTAYAETPPKRSSDFQRNYQTLVKDQHASPQVASCIATGYDLVERNKRFDRLGFTAEDIAKAKTNRKAGKFSAGDPTKVSAVISIPGEARPRADTTNWATITLRCGVVKGQIKAIEIKTAS
ncbi:type IV secretion system effector BspC [Brucella sp. IR073]|uniref:type IV secretion system effector BspC n=1 Tax=unclassified Brucella TaxID=2632610 RepID=UPI003B97F101